MQEVLQLCPVSSFCPSALATAQALQCHQGEGFRGCFHKSMCLPGSSHCVTITTCESGTCRVGWPAEETLAWRGQSLIQTPSKSGAEQGQCPPLGPGESLSKGLGGGPRLGGWGRGMQAAQSLREPAELFSCPPQKSTPASRTCLWSPRCATVAALTSPPWAWAPVRPSPAARPASAAMTDCLLHSQLVTLPCLPEPTDQPWTSGSLCSCCSEGSCAGALGLGAHKEHPNPGQGSGGWRLRGCAGVDQRKGTGPGQREGPLGHKEMGGRREGEQTGERVSLEAAPHHMQTHAYTRTSANT